jgi:thiol:disulfide interchange protein DsbD
MDTVKSVFGVALLAAALVFLKDASPAARGLFSATRAAALAAAGAAALGVLLGALEGGFGGPFPRRLAKGLGVALLVLGIVYGVGAAGARERSRAAASFAWVHSYDEAIARARAEHRPVILDFWAEWCTACKELDRTAWADPRVREAASRFIAAKLDGTDGSSEFEDAVEKYQVVGMPTVIFIDSQGRELPARITGAISAEEMRRWLNAVDRACTSPAIACISHW